MKKNTHPRTVLITGAAEGLGREFSKLYAANGYRLVMIDPDGRRLSALARDLNRTHGAVTQLIVADPSVDAFASRIRAELDRADLRIDELLTRAGFRIYGPFSGKDLEKELEHVCAEYRRQSLFIGQGGMPARRFAPTPLAS